MINGGDFMLKVKLLYDYTKYNDNLNKGIIGYAIETPEEQIERKPDDHFVTVEFPDVTTVHVPWRGLEIVDEQYLETKAAEKDAYFEQLKTAENVICTFGAKGALKSVELDFVENGERVHKFLEDKTECLDYMTYIEKYGVSYTRIQLEKKLPVRKKRVH